MPTRGPAQLVQDGLIRAWRRQPLLSSRLLVWNSCIAVLLGRAPRNTPALSMVALPGQARGRRPILSGSTLPGRVLSRHRGILRRPQRIARFATHSAQRIASNNQPRFELSASSCVSLGRRHGTADHAGRTGRARGPPRGARSRPVDRAGTRDRRLPDRTGLAAPAWQSVALSYGARAQMLVA